MPSYERYETRRRTYGAATTRTAWGYWVPLVVTIGVATAGLAAWIWNERKDEDDDDDYPPPEPPSQHLPPGNYTGLPGTGFVPPSGPDGPPSESHISHTGNAPPGYLGEQSFTATAEQRALEEEGIVSRVSGALRRTPSPQQIFDVASKRVTAGVAAAGAVVGGALASISEEGKGDYEDHSRWSEEADSQNGSSKKGPQLRDTEAAVVASQPSAKRSNRKRKTVALVVSAEGGHEYEEDAEYHQEHAVSESIYLFSSCYADDSQSILSHLPEHVDDDSRIFVLIYDPTLRDLPQSSAEQRTQSMASSFSNIGHEDVQSPGQSSPQRSRKFGTLYTQAQAIVEKETMIMPFTTPTAFIQMLRQLSPESVYLQANLAGHRGEHLDALKSWVGQIVIVVGDESGHGGLVDSEDERGDDTLDKWWLQDSRIGLGKGIEVVEGLRIGEDWGRRIKGHD